MTIIAVMAVDLLLPLGVAAGVPYIIPIFLAGIVGRGRPVILIAVLCTCLTLLGFLVSPEGGEIWKVIANRALAILVIWMAAAFYSRREAEVDERTVALVNSDGSTHFDPDLHYFEEDESAFGNESLSLDGFIDRVAASSVMERGELRQFVSALAPDQRPSDGVGLARMLIEREHLTKYQAALIYHGKVGGLVFGDYVVRDVIGRGGMSVVLNARHRETRESFALKILAPHIAHNKEAVSRFKREIETVTRLDHPNIVRSITHGQQHGVLYLVMELIVGEDLHAIVRRDGAVSCKRAAQWVRQAAKGLHYAHGQQVIHRDVKPSNLMLDDEGRIKILDLGLARAKYDRTPDGDALSQLTATGTMFGSVDFMAPEQALNSHAVDHRCDIYGLGATLYFLLTGKSVLHGTTQGEKLRELLATPPRTRPPLAVERPDAPDWLTEAYRAMVQPIVSQRLGSMNEVIESLRANELVSDST